MRRSGYQAKLNANTVRPEEEISREKALQTVVAGQQAENLLDFDAEEDSAPATDGDERTSEGMGMISSQQIASAAKASNPLDELMDLFSTACMTAPAQAPGAPMGMSQDGSGFGMGAMGGVRRDLISPPPIGSGAASPAAAPMSEGGSASGGKKAEDDLLGLF